jgi:hypothetical protein
MQLGTQIEAMIRSLLSVLIFVSFSYCAGAVFLLCQSVAGEERAEDLAIAISRMLQDPADPTHGIAGEDGERYGHAVTVNYTGRDGDSVEKQVRDTAETALRIGHLVLDRGFTPLGEHLIIKMALKNEGAFINTFSVRYAWSDVIRLAKSHTRIAELAAKGNIETIWLEYWPTMCLNQPPRELFAGGAGDPELPEDVDNPTGKDLSCHRRR